MGLMIGNHDVPRFTSITAGFPWSNPWVNPPSQPSEPYPYARTLLAQSFVLGMPGISTLYYGDELGLMGGPDPDNRRPYPWFESMLPPQATLRTHLAAMGKIRRCLGSNLDPNVAFPLVNDQQLAYLRFQDGAPRLLVVINKSAIATDLEIPLDLWKQPEATQWIDQLSLLNFDTVNEHLRLRVGANETRWLLLENDACQGRGR